MFVRYSKEEKRKWNGEAKYGSVKWKSEGKYGRKASRPGYDYSKERRKMKATDWKAKNSL